MQYNQYFGGKLCGMVDTSTRFPRVLFFLSTILLEVKSEGSMPEESKKK
jgi:hypothetical protein